MKNQEISAIFDSMADMMELLGEDTFRTNSYRTASRALADLGEDIEQIAAGGWKTKIAGIGQSTQQKIEEYCKTGKIERHQEIKAKLPEHIIDLLRLGGMGPKTIAKLWKEAGITSIDELRKCLSTDRDRITKLKGMGEKKVAAIAQSLAFVESTGGRVLLGEAHQIARDLIEQVRKSSGVSQVMAAGSLRRGRETVGDIDLLCCAPKDAAVRIIEEFAASPQAKRVLAKGDTKGSIVIKQDVQVDLRVVDAESFGAALTYFTGSKAHNVALRERAIKRKLKLNEYGLYRGEKSIAGATEEEIYDGLGLPYIPPELREDHGEIEAAEQGRVPRLVELDDIRGDFQMHTTASDGRNSLEEMIKGCRALGYWMMAITDHSRSEPIAGGMDIDHLLAQIKLIHEVRQKFPDMLILASCEVDILKDGSLDYPDDVLEKLDFLLACPHAALNMPGPEATRRLIKAIEHPMVHCIGHPTGRLINSRPGMDIDIEAVAEAAAAHGVALEIDGDFARLDLRDSHVRVVLSKGVKLMINTDSHDVGSLRMMMPYGVQTARRGWATKADVINAWSAEKVKAWLKKGK